MRVLTIYAHHDPRSFCHAVLERFTEGLRDAGHAGEVVDLYAIGFDPALRDHDRPNWIDESVPDDVLEQADALAFIAPVYFVGLPAILKGWIERVFTLGFAFGLTPDGWRGDIGGRVPLLKHEKALIIQTTIFDERAYRAGLKDAMTALIDEYALRYPGIQRVEHEYFYAVHGADDAIRRRYLERAYSLGREF